MIFPLQLLWQTRQNFWLATVWHARSRSVEFSESGHVSSTPAFPFPPPLASPSTSIGVRWFPEPFAATFAIGSTRIQSGTAFLAACTRSSANFQVSHILLSFEKQDSFECNNYIYFWASAGTEKTDLLYHNVPAAWRCQKSMLIVMFILTNGLFNQFNLDRLFSAQCQNILDRR